MDTPGDRIRKAGEQAQQMKQREIAATSEQEAKRQRELRERVRRAGEVAQRFLTVAREMRDQSGWNIYLSLEQHDPEKLDPGFYLTIGRQQRGIRGTLPEGGRQWKVAAHGIASGTRSTVYNGDDDVREAAAQGIEPLMIEAAAALGAQEEEPGQDRERPVASGLR